VAVLAVRVVAALVAVGGDAFAVFLFEAVGAVAIVLAVAGVRGGLALALVTAVGVLAVSVLVADALIAVALVDVFALAAVALGVFVTIGTFAARLAVFVFASRRSVAGHILATAGTAVHAGIALARLVAARVFAGVFGVVRGLRLVVGLGSVGARVTCDIVSVLAAIVGAACSEDQ
jgi:hypothetical protein